MDEANGITRPARANAETLSVASRAGSLESFATLQLFHDWSRLGATWQQRITLCVTVALVSVLLKDKDVTLQRDIGALGLGVLLCITLTQVECTSMIGIGP